MINIRETPEQKIYVSSDFHLNHNPKWETPIWKMRGFSSATDMTDGIIRSVNDTVRWNDILFFLGDFCLNTTLSQFEELLSRFACQNIYMLLGNHPNPHYKNVYLPMVRKILGESYMPESEIFPLRYKNVIYIGHYAEVILNGQFVVLSHYALRSWNQMKHGSWCLHGHEHGAVMESSPNDITTKILDVAWDTFKWPLSFSEISIIMSKKQVKSVGHH